MSAQQFAALAARAHLIHPGDLGSGCQGEVFATLLGSCVAITLWHRRRHCGSICHFIFAAGAGALGADGAPDARYGRAAFGRMRQGLLRAGVLLAECDAKIFGGGRMFALASPAHDVGANNIALARSMLAEVGLPLLAEHVGGDGYRRLLFDVASGEVWIRFDRVANPPLELVL
jgi:chemotaxis protein CheD